MFWLQCRPTSFSSPFAVYLSQGTSGHLCFRIFFAFVCFSFPHRQQHVIYSTGSIEQTDPRPKYFKWPHFEICRQNKVINFNCFENSKGISRSLLHFNNPRVGTLIKLSTFGNDWFRQLRVLVFMTIDHRRAKSPLHCPASPLAVNGYHSAVIGRWGGVGGGGWKGQRLVN